MRQIKFRAWDKKNKKIIHVLKLDFLFESETGILAEGYSDKEYDYKIFPENLELMQYTSLKDKEGIECWEGDLRLYEGKLFKVVNDGWRFRFERNMYEFGENLDVLVDEDSVYLSKYLGNIYENPELLEEKKEGDE